MKVILIDPNTKTIQPLDVKWPENHLKEIYKLLTCSMIECPIDYENGDTMYCDEEAWITAARYRGRPLAGFMFPDWSYAILGKALIVGSNEEGEDVDCKSAPEDFSNIRWRNHEQMTNQGIEHGHINS
jgi:hypothetical protein